MDSSVTNSAAAVAIGQTQPNATATGADPGQTVTLFQLAVRFAGRVLGRDVQPADGCVNAYSARLRQCIDYHRQRLSAERPREFDEVAELLGRPSEEPGQGACLLFDVALAQGLGDREAQPEVILEADYIPAVRGFPIDLKVAIVDEQWLDK